MRKRARGKVVRSDGIAPLCYCSFTTVCPPSLSLRCFVGLCCILSVTIGGQSIITGLFPLLSKNLQRRNCFTFLFGKYTSAILRPTAYCRAGRQHLDGVDADSSFWDPTTLNKLKIDGGMFVHHFEPLKGYPKRGFCLNADSLDGFRLSFCLWLIGCQTLYWDIPKQESVNPRSEAGGRTSSTLNVGNVDLAS